MTNNWRTIRKARRDYQEPFWPGFFRGFVEGILCFLLGLWWFWPVLLK